jgi:hypothetical protein
MIKSTMLLLALVVAFPLASPVVGFAPSTIRLSPSLTTRTTTVKQNHPLSNSFASLRQQDRSAQTTRTTTAWMEASEDGGDEVEKTDDAADNDTKELSGLQKLKRKLFPPKPDDGLTFKQRLGKAGLSVVLSYGFVSNVSYSITVSLAWYIFSKQTGLSPMAPGQWKPFLGVYAGFWVFNNIIRPARFALSIGVSMYFDRFVSMIQRRFRVNKSVAVFLTVFLANVVGTLTLMCTGITLAGMAAGVPVFPPKA